MTTEAQNFPSDEVIKSLIFSQISLLLEDNSIIITGELALIGGDSLLDSMNLIQLCIALEDEAADLGFQFDWTSETAMSRSRGMFRTAGSLASEFISQMHFNQ